jgi:hypothetical protein
LTPLRSAARSAAESHQEAQRNLTGAQIRPLTIPRRILLGLGSALLAFGASLAMHVEQPAAGMCAAGAGLLMGSFAQVVRLWWTEQALERIRRRNQARRSELEAAEEHAQAFAERVASLVELGRTQLVHSYGRGYGKGVRYLEVSRSGRSAVPQSLGSVPELVPEHDVRDTLSGIEQRALQHETRPTNGAGLEKDRGASATAVTEAAE